MEILISLSKSSSEEVSVHWHTEDDTAIAGIDYVASSGEAIFLARETQKVITVDIIDRQTSNWPTYINGARFGGVNSVMALASYVTLVYTHCLDVSCVASGVVKWFDFLASRPSAPNYAGQLTTTAAHQFSYLVPRGAKYYQPSETTNAAHTEMFENQSTPATLNTIKRTLTETVYS